MSGPCDAALDPCLRRGTRTAMAKLYFYYAAMNAGKSTTLLQADFNYPERGMETMLWTAAHDDRSRTRTIGSRHPLSAPAKPHAAHNDLVHAGGGRHQTPQLDAVLIHEP